MKGLLFTYGMTVGGSLAALFNPFYGLLCYVSFAIIRPEAMWPWSVPKGRYSLFLALAMLVGFVFSKQANFRLGRSFSVAGLLLAFLGWSYFEAYFPPNQFLAWDYVERLAKIVVPFMIGLCCIRERAQLQQLAWTIVLSQGYVAYELNSYYFSGYNVLRFAGFGDMDNNSAAIAMVTGIGVAFFLGLHSEKLWQRGIALFFCMLMGHCILFSFSRGGMLGAIVAGMATVVVIPRTPKMYALVMVAAFAAVSLAGPEVRDRFMTTFVKDGEVREASAQSRLDLWRDCWDVTMKDPVMGCGPNHWPVLASSYGWPPGKEAHSLWVQTLAELGFPGLFLYLGFYLLCIFRLWKLTWKSTVVDDEWCRYFARMVIVGLCGFAVSAQFVSLEALEIPYYTALLGCGALKLSQTKQPAFARDSEYDTAGADFSGMQPVYVAV
ncbi:MAG: O-antigen ligase family protein [Planctomycetota bacterium]|jgi:probable O-glycosylation ligase (exosortase A-associated)